MLRTWLQQLDLEALIRRCQRRCQLPSDQLQDSILEIVGAILAREDELASMLSSSDQLLRYLQVSAIRHAIRQHQRDTTRPTDPTFVHAEAPQDPEALLQQALHSQHAITWVNQALDNSRASRKHRKEIQQMVQRILKRPESYIQSRQSGPEEGHYTFRYSQLAKDLGWQRSKLYDRLNWLREQLNKQLATMPLELTPGS